MAEEQKKSPSFDDDFLFSSVGVTEFEPATTRPPDAYSNQLSYTPIVFWRITLEKQDFLCVCECKGSACFGNDQEKPWIFSQKNNFSCPKQGFGQEKIVFYYALL